MPRPKGKKWYESHPNRARTKNFVQVNLKIPKLMRDDLRFLARDTKASMSSLIRAALEDFLIDRLGR